MVPLSRGGICGAGWPRRGGPWCRRSGLPRPGRCWEGTDKARLLPPSLPPSLPSAPALQECRPWSPAGSNCSGFGDTVSGLPPIGLDLTSEWSSGSVKQTSLYFYFFVIYLLCVRECVSRGRRREREGEREREREREREGIPSRLHIVSTEPDVGLNPMNHDITT